MLSKLLCWFGVLLVIEKYLIRNTVLAISTRFIEVVSWFDPWKSRHFVLLFSWPPVRGVCPNHDVVMFQPRTLTPQYLGSAFNCYASYSNLLNLLRPSPTFSDFLLPSQPFAWFTSRGKSAPAHGHFTVYLRHADTKDNSPTWVSPVSIPASRDPSLFSSSSDSSGSLSPLPLPHLPDFQCSSLAVAKISFNVALSCFLSAVCLHHGSRRFPPTL